MCKSLQFFLLDVRKKNCIMLFTYLEKDHTWEKDEMQTRIFEEN